MHIENPKTVGRLLAFMAFVGAYGGVTLWVKHEWLGVAIGAIVTAFFCWGTWLAFTGRWNPPQNGS